MKIEKLNRVEMAVTYSFENGWSMEIVYNEDEKRHSVISYPTKHRRELHIHTVWQKFVTKHGLLNDDSIARIIAHVIILPAF